MKRAFSILALCLLALSGFAQTESAASRLVFEKFKTFYNAGQPDSIYTLFSPEAKISLPLPKTTAFLQQLKERFGLLKSGEFIAYQAAFAQYKGLFARGQLALNLSVDEQRQITGLFAKPLEVKNNLTAMELPFNGEWTVFWGGDTKALNQHVGVKFQQNAFDIVITNKENRSYRTDGKVNEDYYAFGQAIKAPCAGEVVLVVDGVKDNLPGELNTLYIPGNSVIIRTVNNEYVFMAHFKQHSLKVKQGDRIKTGQLLGLCGNSGNSTEPHLHFHLQDMADPLQASGIKCNFAHIGVNGMSKTNYSPIKGDRVSNELQ